MRPTERHIVGACFSSQQFDRFDLGSAIGSTHWAPHRALPSHAAAVRPAQNTQPCHPLPPPVHIPTTACCLLQERVPFQYLLAAAHWRDLVLAVGPGILVPRPETELMIDLAAAALESNPAVGALPWADLGTGSGALAIAAAQLLQQHAKDTPQTPSASSDDHNHQQQQQAASVEAAAAQPRVYAVDLSPTAVAYATSNAEACGVQGAVQAVQGSWFEPLQHLKGQLGGVLSNPPYIPRSDIESGLQAEVALHEPMTALDGGPGEGMDSLQVRLRYEGLRPQLCGVLLCAERTKWLQNFGSDPGINLGCAASAIGLDIGTPTV